MWELKAEDFCHKSRALIFLMATDSPSSEAVGPVADMYNSTSHVCVECLVLPTLFVD